MPSGISGVRASTICTLLSVKSWSPEEMKIFVPVTENEPSSFSTAFVLVYLFLLSFRSTSMRVSQEERKQVEKNRREQRRDIDEDEC
mgnify:CR=1 FL=1